MLLAAGDHRQDQSSCSLKRLNRALTLLRSPWILVPQEPPGNAAFLRNESNPSEHQQLKRLVLRQGGLLYFLSRLLSGLVILGDVVKKGTSPSSVPYENCAL